jgi:hypothetical protein
MAGVFGLGCASMADAAQVGNEAPATTTGATVADGAAAEKAEEFGSIVAKPAGTPQQQERDAYYRKALEVAAIFSPGAKSDEKKKQEAVYAYTSSNKPLAVEMLMLCMDRRNVKDAQLRMGAIHALQAAKHRAPAYSERLASVAVTDSDPYVRGTAAAVVKENKDDIAISRTVENLMGSYNEAGQIANAAMHDNAIAALNVVNDRRVFQKLLYYVTTEIRVTNSELANFATRQIDTITVNNGGNTTLVTPISLPIQFPEMKIARVQTTAKCPAVNALEDLSGQRFGDDVELWKKWLAARK